LYFLRYSLDSGIDYTHIAFGGNGTIQGFDAAFGRDINSIENTQRDDLFPTARVVDGYDFVGDVFSDGDSSAQALPDNDPIDLRGHGTLVASAIVGVAPEVELVAVKVCATFGSCPDFAVILGIEFVLDPNDDGSMDDKVDIVNFSLGVARTSGFYSIVAKAFDDIFELGVLTIIACGNDGNIPFVLGEESKAAHTLVVGATGNPLTTNLKTVESYSSRGPGENNSIKPEIVAPSDFVMAVASTGRFFSRASGTSFSAPIVAGAAALLKERCPECSPFALRTILMNNADPTVKYFPDSKLLAPVSLVGSGELQVTKSFEADFYAFCVEDATPALSLGLIDAASDAVIRRTIRIVNLSSNAQDLTFTFLFREQQDEDSGAVTISFPSSNVSLGADCGSAVQVEVEFRITASLAPSNGMTSGGSDADNVRLLDRQEFDGWITVSSIEKDISLPFLVLLRQAAEVTVANPFLPSIDGSPVDVPIGLVNNGAGVAQIDSYELIFISEDLPESGRGSNNPDSDFRYIGYKVLPVFERDCEYLLEFAITTWERTQRLWFSFFEIRIDTDGDRSFDLTLFNTGPSLSRSDIAECRLRNLATGEETCTGFTVDHSTNTANTVLRVCSNDLGISEAQVINVAALTYTIPTAITSDVTVITQILFPDPALAASSYDILPGDSLDSIVVSGAGRVQNNLPSLGLLLLTNSYRDSSNTGAATKETEALAILRLGVNDPVEVTPDIQELPVTDDVSGPDCTWKQDLPSVCPSTAVPAAETLVDTTTDTSTLRNTTRRLQFITCLENPVPRSNVTTSSPSPAPTDLPKSAFVTQRPSSALTKSSAPSVSIAPTSTPTASAGPIVSSAPSSAPSAELGVSTSPSYAPSAEPSVSRAPSYAPSAGPNVSSAPSYAPFAEPSVSSAPSYAPSAEPSVSRAPSSAPSAGPSDSSAPSSTPPAEPSVSRAPSSAPSAGPSVSSTPSSVPSTGPIVSSAPSSAPSAGPIVSSTPSPSPSRTTSGALLQTPNFLMVTTLSLLCFLAKFP
jgi:hypothetical protein